MSNATLIVDRATHEARKYWRDRLASMSFEGHLALDDPRPRDGQREYASLEQRPDQEVNTELQYLTAGNPFLSAYTTLVLALKIGCSHGESTLLHGGSVAGILQQGLSGMALHIADLAPDYASVSAGHDGLGVSLSATSKRADLEIFEETSVNCLVETQAAKHPESIAVMEGDRLAAYQALDHVATELADTVMMKIDAVLALSTTQSIDSQTNEREADQDVDCGGDSRTGIDESVLTARQDNAGGNHEDGRFRPACVLVDSRGEQLITSSVSHAELARLFQRLNESYGIGTHDRCLFSPSLGTCDQLYTLGMLISGASVEIRDESGSPDPEGLISASSAAHVCTDHSG